MSDLKLSNLSVLKKFQEVILGKEGHVVFSCPTLSDNMEKFIKECLGKEEVEKWYSSMDFNREMTIRGGDVATGTDTVEFFKKIELGLIIAHMLYNCITVGYIELIFLKREFGTISLDKGYFGIEGFQGADIIKTDYGNVFSMRIVFLKVVVSVRIFYSISTYIKNSIGLVWL